MPRRSTSTAAASDTPAERRVTRGSVRKSVEGSSEASTPEKPKSSPRTKASPSSSGGKRGRPKKSTTNVANDESEPTTVADQTETAMNVDTSVDKDKVEDKTVAETGAAGDHVDENKSGEKKSEEPAESKKRQHDEDGDDVCSAPDIKKQRAEESAAESESKIATTEEAANESKCDDDDDDDVMVEMTETPSCVESTGTEPAKPVAVEAAEHPAPEANQSISVKKIHTPDDGKINGTAENEQLDAVSNGDQKPAAQQIYEDSTPPALETVADIPVCKKVTADATEHGCDLQLPTEAAFDGKQNGSHDAFDDVAA